MGRLRPTNSKLRRLRRLLLSTWQSSARLNKNLRKPKKGQSLPWFCKNIINPSPAPSNLETLLEVEIRKNLSICGHFSLPTYTNTKMKDGKLQNRNFKFDPFKHLYFSCFH